jgi:sugar phosphate isomerase/epimerase
VPLCGCAASKPIAYRSAVRHDQIALQLWTVRRPAATDLSGTLRAVAAAGYRAVEVAGLADIRPSDLAAHLSGAGLTTAAVHTGIDRLGTDGDAVADELDTLGCRRAVVPWLPEPDRRSVDGVRRFADKLGALARRLAPRGIRLGYHNHSFEFEPLDGTTIWDALVEALPPEVEIELDLYWAAVGGRDLVAEIRALSGRVRLLHMKDLAPGPTPRDAPAGEGSLPFAAIVDAARAAGVDWYIVEQDEPRDPLDDSRRALAYLQGLAR